LIAAEAEADTKQTAYGYRVPMDSKGVPLPMDTSVEPQNLKYKPRLKWKQSPSLESVNEG